MSDTAGVGKGKSELGQLGGRVGKGKNELVSDTNSFLPGGRVPWPFWLKVHAVPR